MEKAKASLHAFFSPGGGFEANLAEAKRRRDMAGHDPATCPSDVEGGECNCEGGA